MNLSLGFYSSLLTFFAQKIRKSQYGTLLYMSFSNSISCMEQSIKETRYFVFMPILSYSPSMYSPNKILSMGISLYLFLIIKTPTPTFWLGPIDRNLNRIQIAYGPGLYNI